MAAARIPPGGETPLADGNETVGVRVLGEVVSALARVLEAPGAHWQPDRDREGRMAQQAVYSIMRQRELLDWMLKQRARGRIRPRLRRVLWWGLSQAIWGTGMPVPAVIDSCVRFVTRRYARREAGFVNAVLRRALEPSPEAALARALRDAPGAIRRRLGPELHRAWSRHLPDADLDDLAALLLTPAPLTVRLRPGHGLPTDVPLTPVDGLDWVSRDVVYTCTEPARLFGGEAFRAGALYVQDAATLLAPTWLDPKPGESVADLCAAPGGKALFLADLQPGLSRLVCADRSAARLRRLRHNLASVPGAAMVVGDAGTPPLRPGRLDAVLLDVPCSNTGVIRRRPDVRWHFTRAGLGPLGELQTGILDGAAELIRPGGRLVYSTCSIEPEENARRVSEFLARHPDFEMARERQLMPAQLHDGAYVALLKRTNTE